MEADRPAMDVAMRATYTSPMDDVLLAGEGLGRRVGDRWIWRGWSFALKAQERVALVGPSGSGKTMLLRAIAGLDPLDEGKLILDDRPAGTWSPSSYRARVMYLHQRPALLSGSVEDNFRRAFRLRTHRDRHYDQARARDLLEALGRAPSMLTQESSTLSGGEAQVLALVRALLLEPEILLLDEPTSSLDPATASMAESLVEDWLLGRPHRACLWTSHDAAQIDRVATRRLSVEKGGA